MVAATCGARSSMMRLEELYLRREREVIRIGVPPAVRTSETIFARLVSKAAIEIFAAAFWSLCPNLEVG